MAGLNVITSYTDASINLVALIANQHCMHRFCVVEHVYIRIGTISIERKSVTSRLFITNWDARVAHVSVRRNSIKVLPIRSGKFVHTRARANVCAWTARTYGVFSCIGSNARPARLVLSEMKTALWVICHNNAQKTRTRSTPSHDYFWGKNGNWHTEQKSNRIVLQSAAELIEYKPPSYIQ